MLACLDGIVPNEPFFGAPLPQALDSENAAILLVSDSQSSTTTLRSEMHREPNIGYPMPHWENSHHQRMNHKFLHHHFLHTSCHVNLQH